MKRSSPLLKDIITKLRFNAQINNDFELLSWFLCLTKLTLKIDYLSNVCSWKLFWGRLKTEICFLMKLNMVGSHPGNCFCICRNLSSCVFQTVIYAMLMNFFFSSQGSQDRYLLLLIWNRSSRCHSMCSLTPGYTNESRKGTRNYSVHFSRKLTQF